MTLPRKRPRYDGRLASATRISISTATGLNSGERLPCRTVNINKSARKQWRGIAAETDAAIDVTMIAPSTASVNDHSKYPTESSLAHAILASITTAVRGNFRILLRYWNFAAWGTVGWPVNYFSSCVIDLERWRFRRLEEWLVQYLRNISRQFALYIRPLPVSASLQTEKAEFKAYRGLTLSRGINT